MANDNAWMWCDTSGRRAAIQCSGGTYTLTFDTDQRARHILGPKGYRTSFLYERDFHAHLPVVVKGLVDVSGHVVSASYDAGAPAARLASSPDGAALSVKPQEWPKVFESKELHRGVRAAIWRMLRKRNLPLLKLLDMADDLFDEVVILLMRDQSRNKEIRRRLDQACVAFDPWFQKVLDNLCLEAARRYRNDRRYRTNLKLRVQALVFNASVRANRHVDIDLESGLGKLTDRQRAVIFMHAEGLTYEEIGQELLITAEQVRYACSQGIERLRLALAKPQ